MTPTLPELLLGNFMTFIEPPPPEAMGEFLAGKVAVVGLISLLASQEAERGVAACVWENAAIRVLLGREGREEDLSLIALAAVNADLRRELIALHIAAEEAGDKALDRAILEFYAEMAEQRRLDLPPLPAS